MMKRLLLTSLLCAVTSLTVAQTAQNEVLVSIPAEGVAEKINTLGQRYLDLGRFSGNILVAEAGKVIYFKSFGKANYGADQPFSSKTVFKAGPLTELFSHAVYEEMLRNGKAIEAGKDNLGHDQLLAILEKTGKKTYPEMIVEIAEKIQLQNTFFEASANSEFAQGYTHSFENGKIVLEPSQESNELQLKTSAPDLLKLLIFLSEDKIARDGYMKNDGFSHGVLKDGNTSIIILSNRRHPIAGEMIQGINALLRGKNFSPPLARTEVEIDPVLLKEYAGTYALSPEMQLQVLTGNDSLFVLMGPQKVHLKPQSQNQFFMEQGDSAIRFLRDDNGKVTSAELLDGFLTGNRIEKVN